MSRSRACQTQDCFLDCLIYAAGQDQMLEGFISTKKLYVCVTVTIENVTVMPITISKGQTVAKLGLIHHYKF